MNVWAEIGKKVVEKVIVNAGKQIICNNPYITRQQKQFTCNLIDGASFAKDVYDTSRLINDISKNNSAQRYYKQGGRRQ